MTDRSSPPSPSGYVLAGFLRSFAQVILVLDTKTLEDGMSGWMTEALQEAI